MGGYFLLRDNKKTGPYSLNDLKTLGIRETDLLWQEHISTSWKSPIELEELSPSLPTAQKINHKEAIASLGHQIQPLHESFNNRAAEADEPGIISQMPTALSKSAQAYSRDFPTPDPGVQPVANRRWEALKTHLQPREATGDGLLKNTAAFPSREQEPEPEEVSGIIKVILADDHNLFREGVKLALASRPDIQIIGEAATGAQLLTLLHTLIPDIILLDIQMPVMDGIDALKAIRKKYPAIKVIMLSMHEDRSMVSTLLQAGANAYLSKTDDAETIYKAIKTCKEKDFFFNDRANLAMLERLREKSKSLRKPSSQEFDGAELMLKLTHAQKKFSRRQSFNQFKKSLAGAMAGLFLFAGLTAIGYYIYENLELQRINIPKQSSPAVTITPPPSAVATVEPPPVTPEVLITTPQTVNPSITQKEIAPKNGKNESAKTAKKELKEKGLEAAIPAAITTVQEGTTEPTKEVSNPSLEAKTLAKASIYSMVSSAVNDYKKGTLGGLSDINITVSNRSTYTLDRVLVVVQYFLTNDKLFKTETLEFNGLGPASSQTKEAPKSSRGVRLQYRIQSISAKELDL